MPLYICRRWEGTVTAREHQALAWVRANKLRDYPMPPADLPLIPERIVAAGHGVGGIDACLAAVLEPRIAGVVEVRRPRAS